MLEIQDRDAISDDGQEIFNLLERGRIDDVVIMGVHANICVLGRPFGVRQLVALGKRPVVCRDLTDGFHRYPEGHCAGNELILEHIEKYWCPTVSSEEWVGGAPFQFGICREK